MAQLFTLFVKAALISSVSKMFLGKIMGIDILGSFTLKFKLKPTEICLDS